MARTLPPLTRDTVLTRAEVFQALRIRRSDAAAWLLEHVAPRVLVLAGGVRRERWLWGDVVDALATGEDLAAGRSGTSAGRLQRDTKWRA